MWVHVWKRRVTWTRKHFNMKSLWPMCYTSIFHLSTYVHQLGTQGGTNLPCQLFPALLIISLMCKDFCEGNMPLEVVKRTKDVNIIKSELSHCIYIHTTSWNISSKSCWCSANGIQINACPINFLSFCWRNHPNLVAWFCPTRYSTQFQGKDSKRSISFQQFLHLWSIKNPIPTRLRRLRCLSSWSPTEAFWLAGAGNFSSGQKKCPAPGDKTLDFVKWKNPLGRWPFCFVLPCFRRCLKAAATSMAESLWDASLTRLNPIQNPFAWLVWRRFITLFNGRFSLDWTRKVTFCWLILKNTTFDKLVLFCHDPSSGFWFFLKFLEDGLWRF